MKNLMENAISGRNRLLLLTVFVVCAEALSPNAPAATLAVTSLDDSGVGTLREAITTANGNAEDDIIEFSVAGTITLSSVLPAITTNIDFNAPTIGEPLITIDGNSASRILEIGAGGSVNMYQIRFTNALATADSGGAIRISGGGFLLTQSCVFENNSAGAFAGGAIAVGSGGGELHVFNCHFLDNVAGTTGGAIDVFAATAVIIAESLFEANTCTGFGAGALSVRNADTDIASSTFVDNETAGTGGAILTHPDFPDDIAAVNCTIVNNSAELRGGGLGGAGNLAFGNSIIYGNSAPEGPDISYFGLFPAVAPFSIGNNIIGDTSGWAGTPDGSDLVGVDPVLAPLGDYGGPTASLLPHPDDSPAIDAGNNAILTAAFTNLLVHSIDQRLLSRIANGTTDIGAVEFNPGDVFPVPASTTFTLVLLGLLISVCAGRILRSRRQ